jgi:hypothetical protein
VISLSLQNFNKKQTTGRKQQVILKVWNEDGIHNQDQKAISLNF